MTSTETPVNPLELAKSIASAAEAAAIQFFTREPTRHLSTYHGRGACTEAERNVALRSAKLTQLWEGESFDGCMGVFAHFELKTETHDHFWEYRARRTTLMNMILDSAKSK